MPAMSSKVTSGFSATSHSSPSPPSPDSASGSASLAGASVRAARPDAPARRFSSAASSTQPSASAAWASATAPTVRAARAKPHSAAFAASIAARAKSFVFTNASQRPSCSVLISTIDFTTRRVLCTPLPEKPEKFALRLLDAGADEFDELPLGGMGRLQRMNVLAAQNRRDDRN